MLACFSRSFSTNGLPVDDRYDLQVAAMFRRLIEEKRRGRYAAIQVRWHVAQVGATANPFFSNTYSRWIRSSSLASAGGFPA